MLLSLDLLDTELSLDLDDLELLLDLDELELELLAADCDWSSLNLMCLLTSASNIFFLYLEPIIG